jgi:hypothetical protein
VSVVSITSATLGITGIVTSALLVGAGLVLVLFAAARYALRGTAEPGDEARRASDASSFGIGQDRPRGVATDRGTPAAGQRDFAEERAERDHGDPAEHVAPHGSVVVSLRELVDEIVEAGDDETTWLDRTTGEYVTLSEELRAAIENHEELPESGEYDRPRLESIRAKLGSGQLVELPTPFEIGEYSLRERFIALVRSPEQREQLQRALREQSAFHSFEGAVRRLGIAQEWYRVRDGEFAHVALRWLARHGLDYDADVPGAQEIEDPVHELRRAS